MGVSQKHQIIYGLQKTVYKKSLYEFFKKAVLVLEPTTNWVFNWHIKFLCDVLQEDAFRVQQGLPRVSDRIINIPFRSAKSLIFSVIFPAWVWGWFPEAKILTLSYAESLAIKQSYLSKILINSSWYKEYFPEVQLMRDDSGKGHYRNVFGGFRAALGLVGAVTGDGGDFLIIDDPNKPNESKKQLSNANTTFDEVIFNRLNDPEVGQRYVIQQRINENDLSGHLIKKENSEWDVIRIPAELDSEVQPMELILNYKNGLFWDGRFGRVILKSYKGALGSRGYNSQLNQKTSTGGGNLLKRKWFKRTDYDDKTMKDLKWDLFLDSAYTSKQDNDPSAIMICAKWNNDLLIKKVITGHWEFPTLIKKIIEVCKQYGINRIYIEPKASGKSVVQQLRNISRLNVVELEAPDVDKETRVNAVSPTIEGERVWLLDGSWIESFLEEVCTFPLATHDDQVDVLVYAVNKLLIKTGFNYAM